MRSSPLSFNWNCGCKYLVDNGNTRGNNIRFNKFLSFIVLWINFNESNYKQVKLPWENKRDRNFGNFGTYE